MEPTYIHKRRHDGCTCRCPQQITHEIQTLPRSKPVWTARIRVVRGYSENAEDLKRHCPSDPDHLEVCPATRTDRYTDYDDGQPESSRQGGRRRTALRNPDDNTDYDDGQPESSRQGGRRRTVSQNPDDGRPAWRRYHDRLESESEEGQARRRTDPASVRDPRVPVTDHRRPPSRPREPESRSGSPAPPRDRELGPPSGRRQHSSPPREPGSVTVIANGPADRRSNASPRPPPENPGRISAEEQDSEQPREHSSSSSEYRTYQTLYS